ncbi:hypothetical protein BR63_00070 [Thermanaerosceptrum fracticalcis]|jgi:hypothetical protein|uniref:Uncharacterized protein n=1 Tax=Thermanaerosceptrum fracticalcis TaxID=1712410 RepID=A0A7G6DYG0_THEFR|nr:hypothetical protein [Thermanaerosceptrum fracticalcis]QNB44864.1 hypothetical protein BR63_00070 [Thermanaerosceptrum fracticalcis]
MDQDRTVPQDLPMLGEDIDTTTYSYETAAAFIDPEMAKAAVKETERRKSTRVRVD